MLIKLLIVILCLAVFFLILGIYDANRFVVDEQVIDSNKIKKNAKVVVFSDLHNRVYGDNNAKIKEVIERANPDFILIAGDLLTSKSNQKIEATKSLMRYMTKKCPVFYAMGNHETKLEMYADSFQFQLQTFLKECECDNLHILKNRHYFLDEYNIDICGLEIERNYFKRLKKQTLPLMHMKGLVDYTKKEALQILLAHNPAYFETYVEWGADITFSGHVHGGIMRLPVLGGVISPSLHLFPKYDGGIFKKDGKMMLLSRGLGVHSIPLRFFNPGEIHIIYINKI